MSRKLRTLQFWVLLACIVAASLFAQPEGAKPPADDKLLHFVAYACLAISARIAFPLFPSAGILWLSLFSVSVALEFGQLLVPSRHFETYDMAANGIGLLIGMAIWKLLSGLQRRAASN